MKEQTGVRLPRLMEQELALGAYLDALLTWPESEPASAPETGVAADAPVPESAASSEPVRPGAAEAMAQRRPEWAAEPFQCLLFKVSGLTLAIPLVTLSSVLQWPQEITPMPGHTSWFLGLMRHHGVTAKVIDTAALVLPEERGADLCPAGERTGNLLLIDDARWALACDTVAEVIVLDPEGVRWRTISGKRPWLAGTVVEHMCALLDTQAFAHMLASGERD